MTDINKSLFETKEIKQLEKIKQYIDNHEKQILEQRQGLSNILFYYDEKNKKVTVYEGLYSTFNELGIMYNLDCECITKIGKFNGDLELTKGECYCYNTTGQLTRKTTKNKEGGIIEERYHKGQLQNKTTKNTEGKTITEWYNEGQLTSKTTKNKERETIEESTNEYIKKYDYKDNNDVIEDIYLKNTPEDQQIKENNKIFTSKHNTTNNTKTLTFHTTHPKLGDLNKDITIEIDENGIETLKDGDLTEEDKIKLKNTFEDKKNLALLINVIGDSCFYLNLILNNQLTTKDNILGKSRKTFLQTIEEKTTDGIADYIENQKTGGEFIVYNRESNEELGNLSLIRNKFYITNKDTGTIIPFSFKNIQGIKDKYNIYYKSKDELGELQQVLIKDENDVQMDDMHVDSSIFFSFDRIEPNNPNSELYLRRICNLKVEEAEEEIVNSKIKKKKLIEGQGECYNNPRYIMQLLSCKEMVSSDNNIYTLKYLNNQLLIKDKINLENGLQNTIFYNTLHTIQQGKFKDGYLYSGSAHLRRDPEDKSMKQINLDNKIYTLNRDEDNNTRTLTFYGKAIDLEDGVELQMTIDKNNIATLQGEPLTENKTDKIKAFFNNIPVKQLSDFDDYLATLYYTTIMNKEEYKDTNILIPDLCKYNYKEGEEVDQTIAIINQIPQDKRKGKYIVPCNWLRLGHQVNLRIDFDNKICEIVNTGGYAFIDETVINNLQQELREQFEGEEWVVYENNIMRQSTGNCVIASNITATEKTVVEKQVEEYNKKIKQLEEVNKEIENIKEQKDEEKDLGQQKQQLKKELQELLNIIINNNKDKQTLTVEKLKQQAQSLLIQHNDKIEQVIINEILYNDLRNEVEKLKKEKQELQKQQQKEKQKDEALLSTSLSTDINEEELLNELLRKQSIEERINIIRQDTERLQIEKENFVRYNLLSKERLFNGCGKQFDREFSEDIVNEGNGIKIPGQM